MSEYQVKLYYGFEEMEYDIFHAFEAIDPDVGHDDAVIAKALAEQLDADPDSDNYSCYSMYINLPASLIERIKADAIREYNEGVNTNGQ